QVQQEFAVDPFSQDFFQRFFSQGMAGGIVAKELKTKPITVNAAALPEGKPPSFSGAVGRYRISAETDKRKVKAGDALNLSVTIEGTGNLKAIAQPSLPDLSASFRLYDTVSSLNLQKDETGVRGSKSFKTVLVPKVSGPLRVPAIPFSYFDPQKKAYISLETAPLDLEVEPGAAAPQAPGFPAPMGGGAITQLADDIRHVKPPRASARLSAGATRRLWPHLIPLGVFLASFTLFLRRESLLRDPAGTRARRAFANAGRLLARARDLQASEPRQAAGLLSEAILGYLADKLDCPASGLTRKQVAQLLLKRYPRIPEGHLERFKMLLDELELPRFATSAPGAAKDGAQRI
ncbi:MAG: BatD family protein, partial [Elusimicrobiota bacterium]